jgi:hypothetical protein
LIAVALGACDSDSRHFPLEPQSSDRDGDGVRAGSDCDDGNAAIFRILAVFEDVDSDGIGTGTVSTQCAGVGPPLGFAIATGDCADNDASKFAMYPYAATDRDLDGHIVVGGGFVCAGAERPLGYLATVPADLPADAHVECDDQDFAGWRMAGVYVDVDGDGTGSGSVQVRCIGKSAPVGFSLFGYDPVDALGDRDSALVSTAKMSSWLRIP